MPWILLLFGAASVLFTVNAWRPFRAHPIIGGVAFFAGWLTSELPFHHIVWQAMAVAGLVAAGALADPQGWVGLALMLGSWGGLVATHRLAISTRDAVERGLDEGLGAATLPEPQAVSWWRVALPLPGVGRRVVRVRNLVYSEGDGARLRLDVYHRADKPQGRPVLLQVHGGAWILGRKDDQGLPLMNRMADEGWVCVSVNYRLSPRFTFPAPVIDLKRAIAWIQENIADYGGDGSRIVITGGSAGGHLAALAALTPSDPEYQPGFEEVDTHVLACVAFYGVYDFTNDGRIWHPFGLPRLLERRVLKVRMADDRGAYERASPYCRAGAQAPPFLLIHGTADTLVPLAEARRFFARLKEVSQEPVALIEVPGAQHAFEVFPSVRTERATDAAARFLAWVIARGEEAQGSAAAAPSLTPPETPAAR